MVKNVVEQRKVELNSLYGVRAMLNINYLGNDTILKNAKIISKIIINRAGFLYADTDDTYVIDLDKK